MADAVSDRNVGFAEKAVLRPLLASGPNMRRSLDRSAPQSGRTLDVRA